MGASGTTRFLYDGDALVGEYDGGGNLLRRYVHGVDLKADDPIAWYEGSGFATANERFMRPDWQGSIAIVSDSAGANALAVNTYDEYGIPGSGNQGRFQYTGQAWQPDLGMYYYKARFYSPTLGRFMQTDPIGYAGGQTNIYAYVGDDPVDGTDPSGTIGLPGEGCAAGDRASSSCKGLSGTVVDGGGNEGANAGKPGNQPDAGKGVDHAEKANTALGAGITYVQIKIGRATAFAIFARGRIVALYDSLSVTRLGRVRSLGVLRGALSMGAKFTGATGAAGAYYEYRVGHIGPLHALLSGGLSIMGGTAKGEAAVPYAIYSVFDTINPSWPSQIKQGMQMQAKLCGDSPMACAQ